MTNNGLESDLTLDFRPEDRHLFFDEMIAAARDFQSTLGGESTDPDEISHQIEALMRELDQETVEFSPHLEIYPLRKKNFTDHGLEIPPQISDRMRRYKFYLVQFPITMVPKPGWGFVQLDCMVEFNPMQDASLRPVAYQIFPQEAWEPVIRASQGLSVGLDENFQFMTPVVSVPGIAEAGVGLAAGGQAQLILGPFNYDIRRPKIISRGIGNAIVRWRLDGEKNFEHEEPRLAVVLQTPKTVDEMTIIGVLKASKRFHPFTAHVRHLAQYVRERTRNFFDQGAPIARESVWDVSSQI